MIKKKENRDREKDELLDASLYVGTKEDRTTGRRNCAIYCSFVSDIYCRSDQTNVFCLS